MRSISMYIAILRGEAGPGLVRNRLVGLNISIWGPIPGLKMALNRLNGPKSLLNRLNRIKIALSFELVIFSIFRIQSTYISRRCLGHKCRHLVLLEVKISDQYVNILSILRGDALNNQYQYLQGRESIFLDCLT